ncbi:MAG: hypothetical protein ACKOKF_11930, partial [Bacteroidota bacterium]
LSALFNSIGILFFALGLRQLKFRLPLLAATALASVPVIYLSGIITIDYSLGFAFLMSAFYTVCLNRSLLTGIFLGLAIGCRVTSGAMLLPYALMLLQNDGLHKNLWRIFNSMASAIVVGAICFLPVFLRYGSEFFTYYDVPYPSIPRVLYRGFIEVWGVVGFIGLVVGILMLFLPSSLTRSDYLFPRSVNIRYVIAWLVAIDFFIIAFIKLPMEAGYLIPAVPFIILIFGKYLIRPAFTLFACCMILSPFLVSISPAERKDAEEPSVIAVEVKAGEEKVIVDILKGPLVSYESRRLNGLDYVEQLLISLDTIRQPAVLVAGQWYNKLVFAQGDTLRGATVIAPHVKREELLSWVSEGRDILFLPQQDAFNVQLKGADPKIFGGELYE